MKLAIPTDDKINLPYHLRFTNGFLIVEIIDGEIKNQDYRSIRSSDKMDEIGSTISYRRIVESVNDCDLIILYALNSSIQKAFNEVGIDIFITSAINTSEAIKLFLQGKLMKLKKLEY